MRQAGVIADGGQAERFSDYLLSIGIPSHIDPTDGAYVVWIRDDLHLERGRQELKEFLADPDNAKYLDAGKAAAEVRREQEARQRQYSRNVVDVRTRWAPWQQGAVPLTFLLIAASIGLTMATDFGKTSWARHWLYIVRMYVEDGMMDNGLHAVREGQVWRLVTPVFLHGNFQHLIFNMLWMYQIGALIENRRGWIVLLGLVLAIAVLSNLAQYFWDGPNFLGMSGVGFGLFGYLWMKSKFDPAVGLQCPPELVIWSLIWMALCFTGMLGAIANAAHVGGLLVGMAIAYFPVLWRDLFAE